MKFGLLFFLLIVSGSLAGQSKIGVVDTLFLLEKLPSRNSMVQIIEAKELFFIKELTAMDSTLNSKIVSYEKYINCFPKTPNQQENELRDIQSKIQQYEKDADKILERMTDECNQQSMKIIRQAIREVSSNLKLNVVWDKSMSLYSSDELDITDEVLVEMLKIDRP